PPQTQARQVALPGPVGFAQFSLCSLVSPGVMSSIQGVRDGRRLRHLPERQRMKTKGEQFAGVTVALVTPFRDGEIDFGELNRLVDWHVQQGTDCLSPVATTGESPTLDHDEHERVIAAVVERAAKRIKVLPGTGSNSTREAIHLTRFAHRAGADGALMVGPYYNKPTQE